MIASPGTSFFPLQSFDVEPVLFASRRALVRDEVRETENRHLNSFESLYDTVFPGAIEGEARDPREDVYSVWRKAELNHDIAPREVFPVDVEILERRSELGQRAPHSVGVVGRRIDP